MLIGSRPDWSWRDLPMHLCSVWSSRWLCFWELTGCWVEWWCYWTTFLLTTNSVGRVWLFGSCRAPRARVESWKTPWNLGSELADLSDHILFAKSSYKIQFKKWRNRILLMEEVAETQIQGEENYGNLKNLLFSNKSDLSTNHSVFKLFTMMNIIFLPSSISFIKCMKIYILCMQMYYYYSAFHRSLYYSTAYFSLVKNMVVTTV